MNGTNTTSEKLYQKHGEEGLATVAVRGFLSLAAGSTLVNVPNSNMLTVH